MTREEFLKELSEALDGEVPVSVIRENLDYYSQYLSQELAKGRSMEEITDEIGEARIVAKTIIDTCEAAGEAIGEDAYRNSGRGYEDAPSGGGQRFSREPRREDAQPHIHYFDLSKWYWKVLFTVLALFFLSAVIGIVGGIFALVIRFAGPILVILLLYWFIKNMRR